MRSDDYRRFWDKFATGTGHAGQFQRFGKAGRETWLQATYVPLLDAQGKPYRVIEFAVDVTAQKHALRDAMEVVGSLSKGDPHRWRVASPRRRPRANGPAQGRPSASRRATIRTGTSADRATPTDRALAARWATTCWRPAWSASRSPLDDSPRMPRPPVARGGAPRRGWTRGEAQSIGAGAHMTCQAHAPSRKPCGSVSRARPAVMEHRLRSTRAMPSTLDAHDGDASPWHAIDIASVLAQLAADATRGLTASGVIERRARFGRNELPAPPRRAAWRVWLGQFRSPSSTSCSAPPRSRPRARARRS